HFGLVDVAVTRIENVAVLVIEALALHIADERNAEHRLIAAVIRAAIANGVRWIGGPRKRLGDRAFEDAAAVVDEQDPDHRLAVDLLLPQAGDARLRLTLWRGLALRHRRRGVGLLPGWLLHRRGALGGRLLPVRGLGCRCAAKTADRHAGHEHESRRARVHFIPHANRREPSNHTRIWLFREGKKELLR